MHFLFPTDPIQTGKPDAIFREQADQIRRLGLGVSIVCLEDLASKNCRIRNPIPVGVTVVYRGWMLSPPEYEALLGLIESNGGRPLTSLEMYLSCHYLPNWYPLIPEFTAETRIFPRDSDIAGELTVLTWGKFFIKDYVKSLKTSVGSVVSKPEEIKSVLDEMEKFRGTIEGGVCVRRFEDFIPNSERRYFVVRHKPHASSGIPPDIVFQCAQRIESPFFSVDVAERTDGVLRVVEIGDGQVSDLVGWDPRRFAELWKDIA